MKELRKRPLNFFFFFGNFPGRFFTEHSEKKSFWKLLKSKIEIIKLPVKRFLKKRSGYLFTRAITNYCCLCWMHFHWWKISQEFVKLRLTKTQSSKVWLSKKAIVNVFWDKNFQNVGNLVNCFHAHLIIPSFNWILVPCQML